MIDRHKTLIGLLVFFVLGILISDFYLDATWILPLGLTLFTAFFACLYFFQHKMFFYICLCFVSLSLGGLRVLYENKELTQLSYDWEKQTKSKDFYTLKVSQACAGQREQDYFLAQILDSEGFSSRFQVKVSVSNSITCEWVEGDQVEIWGTFKDLRGFKNDFSFDAQNYWKRKGVFGTVSVLDSDDLKMIHKMNSIRSRLKRGKYFIIKQLRQDLHVNASDFILAVVLGVKAPYDSYNERLFKKLGLKHILVVSGLHMGIVYGLCFSFFYLIFSLVPHWSQNTNAYRLALICPLLICFFYADLLSWATALTRSYLMLSFVFLSLVRGRSKDAKVALLSTALLALIYRPFFLWELGFQLSYLATAILVYFSPVLWNFWKEYFAKYSRFKSYFFQTLWVAFLSSFFVTCATLPLLAHSVGEMNLYAALNNFIFSWFFTLILIPFSFLCLVIFILYPSLGMKLFENFAFVITHFMQVILDPWSQWQNLYFFHNWTYLQSLIVLLSLKVVFVFFQKKISLKSFFVQLLILILVFPFAAKTFPTGALVWTQMDVGQGESALLQLPNGKNILIDAGGFPGSSFDVGEGVLLSELKGRGIDKIDILILSHSDYDHYGGMSFLLDHFLVGEFWWNGDVQGSISYLNLLNKIANKKIPMKNLAGKSNFQFDQIFVNTWSYVKEESKNNRSLMTRFCYLEVCFLLAGDIEESAEKLSLQDQEDFSARVFKLSHHGSKTSSSWAWLVKTQAKLALLSVGQDNRFHLPSQTTLEKLEKLKIPLLRTDQRGQIQVRTDGKHVFYKTYDNSSEREL